MSNRIDDFFKRKLSDLKTAPSEEAWSRIEATLTKKNSVVVYWRMAAALLLCSVLIGAWFLSQKEKPELAIIKEEKNIPTIKESMTDTVPQQDQTIIPNLAEKNKPQPSYRANPSRSSKNEKIKSEEEELPAVQEDKIPMEQHEPILALEEITVAAVTKTEKPIVIEFTLAPVPETNLAQVVQVEEKKTGLKRIWETARDLKNGEADFSVLRDAKNELLALDFRKDKTKLN